MSANEIREQLQRVIEILLLQASVRDSHSHLEQPCPKASGEGIDQSFLNSLMDTGRRLERTHIHEAPWWIVDAVDKKRARLNCIHHLLSLVRYREIEHPTPTLPARVHFNSLPDWLPYRQGGVQNADFCTAKRSPAERPAGPTACRRARTAPTRGPRTGLCQFSNRSASVDRA
jgi:hypothetical protein